MRLSVLACAAFLSGCAIFASRPVQEMSNTSAAIRAAREVQADTLAPELFRQAKEWFFRAKQEYQLKNFQEARKYALKSRRFAEEAEYVALTAGGNRTSAPPDPLANPEILEPKKPEPEKPKSAIEPKKNEIYYETYEEQEKQKKQTTGGGDKAPTQANPPQPYPSP